VNAPLRVLIADDSEPVRQSLRVLLEAEGHEVVGEAPDGRAAVVAALEFEPDLVIMDWLMPVMDGVTATREIRVRSSVVEVIGFSSREGPELREQFLQAGAKACVDKAGVDALLSAIKALRLT
jgi:two-component system, NarL family, response regulator LiaR